MRYHNIYILIKAAILNRSCSNRPANTYRHYVMCKNLNGSVFERGDRVRVCQRCTSKDDLRLITDEAIVRHVKKNYVVCVFMLVLVQCNRNERYTRRLLITLSWQTNILQMYTTSTLKILS